QHLFSRSSYYLALPSFPTRRSSDLGGHTTAWSPKPSSSCAICSIWPKPVDQHRLTTPGASRRSVDILIIGGGQAGLAAGYYLHRLNRDAARNGSGRALSFAILDANEHPGGAWQHYWDSLELFSPAAYSSLPGWPMPFWPGPGNPSAAHVVSYLKAYQDRYTLPVHRPVQARTVRALPK